jgi:hypothetical protein
MTARSSILTDLDGSVTAVTGMGQVESGKWRDFDLKDVTLPVAFITLQGDEPAEAGIGFEAFWVTASIEVWCADSSMETLIGGVHTAIMADVTQGGNAMNTKRDSCVPFAIDPTRGLAGFSMTFRILYRHAFGSP